MHRRRKSWPLALSLCVLPAGLSAADSPTGRPAVPASVLEQLTLREAEKLAIQHNREIRLARRAVEGAEAEVVIAGARPNPALSINMTQISPSTGIGSGSLRDKRVDTVIGLSQLVERGNKRELRLEAAEHALAAVRSERADVERQQRVSLHAAYYDLVLAQEKLRISQETAELYEKTLDAAERRLKAGDISATELARIRVDALRAQNDARAALAERERAQVALAYLIGVERDAVRIYAADGWPGPEQAPSEYPLERALEARADVRAAQARVLAAEKGRELARALRTRDVTVGIQYERFPGDLSNNSYGFTVSIPLFANYFYEGEIRRAEVELSTARDNLERVRALAISEISKSRADVQSALDRVRRFREVLLAAAQKAATGAEFAYARGAIGVMDLLDARRQLYTARLEYAAVQADYAKALAVWRAATGESATP
jgi:cobalt-zinc-cadmium efflux system outer membrane protein